MGSAQQRNNGLCQYFHLGEIFSSSCPDARHSVSSRMSPVPFELLLLQWGSSVGVILSSPCLGSLGGMPVTSGFTFSSQPQSPLVFKSSGFENFSSWHWNPELGSLYEILFSFLHITFHYYTILNPVILLPLQKRSLIIVLI